MWLLTTLGNYPCLSVGFLPEAYILHKNRIVRLQFQIIKWNDMDVKKNLWNYSEPCEMEEKSQGDPVTLQCFVFIGTISGAVEPAAIFQDRSAASFVGIQAADQNFGKAEAFAVRLHIFQHPGGIAFSADRKSVV